MSLAVAELDDVRRQPGRARAEKPAPLSGAASASKAMQVLAAFDGSRGAIGVSELARRSGTSKSTAFRLLSALAQHGFVDRRGPKYELSWRIFELGNQVSRDRAHGLQELAGPVLAELYAAAGYSVQLAMLQGADVVIVQSIRAHDALPAVPTVGARMPAHTSAAGKAILAFSDRDTVRDHLASGLASVTPSTIVSPQRLIEELATVRDAGVAHAYNEWRQGLAEVAAPVIVGGRALAAISVALPALPQLPPRCIPHVRRAATQLSRARGQAG